MATRFPADACEKADSSGGHVQNIRLGACRERFPDRQRPDITDIARRAAALS
jgi:hypothetical protein